MPEPTHVEGAEASSQNPDHLLHRQNFYDQPPFQDVIAGVAGQYSGRVEGNPTIHDMNRDLASLLTYFARTHADPMDASRRALLLKSFFDDVASHLPVDSAKAKYTEPARAAALKAGVTDVLEALKPHKYWMDYVKAKLHPGHMYEGDGTYRYGRRRKAPPDIPEAYIAYHDERKARDARIASSVARGVAEQMADPASSPGGPPGSREATGKAAHNVARPVRKPTDRPRPRGA